MGKSQTKKKTQAWRHNPIRVPDAHVGAGKAEGKADPGKEKQMLPILKKLSSPEYADRTWACAAICNLIQNDAATRRLFQSRNVVGELIERLSDSVDEVVVEASGALRNLAIDGGHELCSEMFNKGIMSHLTTLTVKISATIDTILASDPSVPREHTDAEAQSRKHLLALSENIISLIWCLAEASHKTLNAVNGAGVEGLLVKVVEGRKVVGAGVTLAAVQALYSLTQDNWPFTSSLLRHPSAIYALAELCREDHTPAEEAGAKKRSKKGKGKSDGSEEVGDGRALLSRLLACGILRNIVKPGSRSDEDVDIQRLTNEVIMPLVNEMLDLDLPSITNRVSQLASEAAQTGTDKPSAKDMKTDHQSTAEQTLERIERMLNTVVVALEILTGICAGLEDEEEKETAGPGAEVEEEGMVQDDQDEDEEMDSDEAEMDDEDLINEALDHADMAEDDEDDSPTKVNTAVTIQSLLSHHLPRRLAKLGQLTPLSFPPAGSQPSSHPPTTSVLSTLHLRSYEALNNLLLTVVASQSGSTDDARTAEMFPLQELWSSLMGTVQMVSCEPDVLKERGQEMRPEVLEMALGCLWGIIKLGPGVLTITADQLQLLLSLSPLLRTPLARTRLIESLSTLASRPSVSPSENQLISTSLLSSLTGSTEPETTISLVNALIDIYADETREYDAVFRDGGYLAALTSAVGGVRSAVRKVDKKKEREMRARGEEAVENLTAFIKYRRQLAKSS